MKAYFLKAAGAITLFAFITSAAFAQEGKKEATGSGSASSSSSTNKQSDDVIIIRPKADADTKLTIEIKGADVKVNGQPLSDYKNDDIIISRRKQQTVESRRLAEMDALYAPRTKFRGGTTMYSYGDGNNMVTIEGMNTNKAFLGVGTEKAAEGVTITSISDESGAAKAGLKVKDVITMINTTKVSSPEELTKTIGKFNPNDKITITYKRDKKVLKTTATLSNRKTTGAMTLTAPDAYAFRNFNFDNNMNYNFTFNGKARLGIRAQETEDGKGLKVLGVDDGSTAAKAGIKEGDIITSFDGTEVNNVDSLRGLAKPAIDKGSFKVKLLRDGKSQEVEIKIPKNLKTTSL